MTERSGNRICDHTVIDIVGVDPEKRNIVIRKGRITGNRIRVILRLLRRPEIDHDLYGISGKRRNAAGVEAVQCI